MLGFAWSPSGQRSPGNAAARDAMRGERVPVSRMSSALLTRVDFRDTLLGEIFVGFLDFRMCKLLRLDVYARRTSAVPRFGC